jgi:hypothetical protein
MRLTADQVREALLHPNEGVRQLAFAYFADAYTTDTAVTATVLDAIAKYGTEQFVPNYHGFGHLPHTAESVRWVVEQLVIPPAREPDYGRRPFSDALFECPFDLFAPHEATLPALRIDDSARDQLRRRREFHELPDDAVWERLGEVCRRLGASQNPWAEMAMEEAEGLERTAGDRPTLAERVLSRVHALAPGVFNFLDMFALRIAGRLRLTAALPALVEFTAGCDDDGWHEDLEPALTRIGTDECVRLLRERWADGEWNFRYTAAWVMGNLHTDASVAACLELAAADPEPYSRDSVAFRLLEAAVTNFDTAAVEPTRQFLLKAPHTWDSKTHYERDLRGSLIDACTLTGERFPEYDRWRREEIEADAMARKRMAGLEPMLSLPYEAAKPEPPRDTIVGKATAGRNDPCPCGSGKKFKKCHGK